MAAGRVLSDFTIGDAWTTPARTITGAMVDMFAGVTGDFNPVHTDHPGAKKGLFGEPVAHGVLVLGVTVGLWMRAGGFEGAGFAGIDGLRWIKPVGFGTTVHARMAVTHIEDRGGHGIVVVHNEVLDDQDDVVLVFDARLAVGKS